MKLEFIDNVGYTAIKVVCKGFVLGYLQVNKYVRREKSTEFSGMGINLFYDSYEDAKNNLGNDLSKYFNKLMEEDDD